MGMQGESGVEDPVLVTMRREGDGAAMMKQTGRSAQELAAVVGDLVADVVSAVRSGSTESVLERTRGVVDAHAPRLKRVSHRVGADVGEWMQQGGLWRSLLVMSVGLIAVTAVTGLSAFLMAVLVATVNAVIIGFLMCLSAVGAFLAMFCTTLTFIYIGALATAAVVIGSAVFMASSAVIFFTGWILFAWATWEVMKKSTNFVRDTLGVSKKEEIFVA